MESIETVLFTLMLLVDCGVNSIGQEHEQVINWWLKVSEQKPLSYEVNPSYLEPFHPITTNLISSWKIKRIINLAFINIKKNPALNPLP